MKSYNKKYSYYKAFKDINEVIVKRYNILISLIIFVMSILVINLFYIQVIKNNYYKNKINTLTKNIVYGSTAPRGRIYDRNGNLLVDNKAIKVIYYKKTKNVSVETEIELADLLSTKLEIDGNITDKMLRTYFVDKNKEIADKKITEEELQNLKERKITVDDIYNYKLERVTNEELSTVDSKMITQTKRKVCRNLYNKKLSKFVYK